MRKYLLIMGMVLGISSLITAGDNLSELESIQISTRNTGGRAAAFLPSVTIGRESGIRPCLSNVDVMSNNSISLDILSGPLTSPTTLFSTIVSSGTLFSKSWTSDVPLCGDAASTMTVTTALYLTGSATVQINMSGYKRKR